MSNSKRHADWPPRPESFSEVLTTEDVAMLLRLDAEPNRTPENAARTVRSLVKNQRLPVCGRVGKGLRFRRDAVLAWLDQPNDVAGVV